MMIVTVTNEITGQRHSVTLLDQHPEDAKRWALNWAFASLRWHRCSVHPDGVRRLTDDEALAREDAAS